MKANRLAWGLVAVFVVLNLVLAFGGTDFSFVDEQVYEAASLQILHNQPCNIGYLPLSTLCNYEHPPLVKLFEAVSAYVLGWTAPNYPGYLTPQVPVLQEPGEFLAAFLSFRFFQMLMGAASVFLVYYIARSISKNDRLGLLAAVLLLLEPLFSFFSRTTYLDIPMVFFGLAAYAVYFGTNTRLKPSRAVSVGALLAASVLCKETGLVFVFPLVAYHALYGETTRKGRDILTIIASEVLVFGAGLQAYDTLAGTPFPTFLSHVYYMTQYASLIACGSRCYSGFLPPSPYTFPIGNYVSELLSNNQPLLWLAFGWLPIGLAGLFLARKREGAASPDGRLFVFAAMLFGATFIENELIYFGGRIVWIWYFLPVIPSLALGGAYLLTRPRIPLPMRLGLAALIFFGYGLALWMGPGLLLYD